MGAAFLKGDAAPAKLIVTEDYCRRLIQFLRPINIDVKVTSLFFLEANMKLRLLQSMAGIDFSHNVGDIIEVNDAEAVKRYIERGIAEIVEPAKKEKAIKKTAKKETATKA